MLVATLAMTDDTILPFSFPAVSRKKITAAFDGGRLTSNGGVMLLAMADRRIGVAEKLSLVFPERRDATRIVHSLADMIRARMFAIACGYEDSDDLDHLRADPAFKLACGRLPDTDRDLCSQPTLSRLENAPRLREVIRLTYALVDLWMDSYTRVPSAVTLDIDDTVDVVHGYQQLSLFNAHYDERCFLPIHVYDTERSRPVAVVLRPGKTPSGVEVRSHLRRLVRRIRRRWPETHITFRGDDLVRAERHRLHLRPVRHQAARPEGRRGRRCDSNRPRRGQQGGGARLYRNPPRGRILGSRASRRRPHRSDRTRARHSLRRHEPRDRLGTVDLRQPLLRARAGGKSDQAAQDATRVRSHQLPFRACQPGSPRLPYRRLLAHAHRPRCHSKDPRSRNRGVRDP